MTDLDTLIERVKALTGPDREVDAAIGSLIRYHPYGPFHWLAKSPEAIYAPTHAGWMGFTLPGEDAPRDAWLSPEYTASIESDLALCERVLPGWEIALGTCGQNNCPWACLTEPKEPFRDFAADAPAAELALIEAILSALKAQEAAHD